MLCFLGHVSRGTRNATFILVGRSASRILLKKTWKTKDYQWNTIIFHRESIIIYGEYIILWFHEVSANFRHWKPANDVSTAATDVKRRETKCIDREHSMSLVTCFLACSKQAVHDWTVYLLLDETVPCVLQTVTWLRFEATETCNDDRNISTARFTGLVALKRAGESVERLSLSSTSKMCTWWRPWCLRTRRAWPIRRATAGGRQSGFPDW